MTSRWQTVRILLFASGACLLSAMAAWGIYHKHSAQQQAHAEANASMDLENRINLHISRLFDDTRILWENTEAAFDDSHRAMVRSLRTAGRQFSENEITRVNIAVLLKHMTIDYFDEGERADQWFADKMDPYFKPVLLRYARNQQQNLNQFQQELAHAIDDFNERIFADFQLLGGMQGTLAEKELLRTTLEGVFVDKGIRFGAGTAAGTTVTIAGASYYTYGTLMRLLSTRLRAATLRILGPAAGRVAGRAIASMGSSTIPAAGLIVSAAGTAWTTADIYRMRGETQQAFAEALEALIVESEQSLTSEIKEPILLALNRLQENPDNLKQAVMLARSRSQ